MGPQRVVANIVQQHRPDALRVCFGREKNQRRTDVIRLADWLPATLIFSLMTLLGMSKTGLVRDTRLPRLIVVGTTPFEPQKQRGLMRRWRAPSWMSGSG